MVFAKSLHVTMTSCVTASSAIIRLNMFTCGELEISNQIFMGIPFLGANEKIQDKSLV